MPTERVTVTLPAGLVEQIDRQASNRSRFILDAIRRELQRRRRAELRRSLRAPHPETENLAQTGLEEWARGLPEEDVRDLVDPRAGRPLRWVPGRGWRAERTSAGCGASLDR